MLQRGAVSSASSNFCARTAKASAAGPSPAAGGWPASDASRRLADSGSRPRKAMPNSFAAASAPPLPERVGGLAAMRADVAGHILDDPDDRHARLAEQVDRARGVDQRQVLRRRDDHRAGGLYFWIIVSCTSPVPGGRSTRMISVSPQSPSISCASALRRHRPAPRDRLAGCDQLAHRQQRHALRRDRDQSSASAAGGSLVDAEQGRLRGAVDVGVDQPDAACPAAPARPRDWRQGSICRRRPCRCRPRSRLRPGRARGHRDAHLGDAGHRQGRRA